MTELATSFVLAGLLATSPHAGQASTQGKKPTAAPQGRACSVLTKEEVRKLAGTKDQFFDMVPPREETLSRTGSACFYSGITIQIDPFTPSVLEENRKKKGTQWQVVTGVADTAYVFDNKPGASLHYAELYGVVGPRVFTIQMSVRPPEASAETVRPGLLALAKAIAARLR